MTIEQINVNRTSGVQPWRVLNIISGYRKALVVLAARRLRVFNELSRHPCGDRDLAEVLGLHHEVLRDMLHVLVELDLVSRDEHGIYELTPSATCLLPNRPGYIGGLVELYETELHPAWAGLIQSARTGSPAPKPARNADDTPYSPMYSSDPRQEAFLDAMDFIVTPLAHELGARDWSRFRTVLDVGGARGHLAMILAQTHPHLTATVFDLPELAQAYVGHLAGQEGSDRVAFRGGDFFRDPLPRADVVILGHVLHNWPLDARRTLIRSAFEAVNPGGALVVYDAMLDEDTPRMSNSLLSLDMRLWSGGSEYLADDCIAWLTEVGFRDVERHPHGVESTLVIGHKP
jgi:SAM-dependent methyltransferase/DNA-binding HxlR family transcriptional regulator